MVRKRSWPAVCAPPLSQHATKTQHVVTHIPNLKLDRLALELDGANLEVYTNGADVRLCVGVILGNAQK